MSKINGLMARDYLESGFFVDRVKLHEKDNTDKKWSYKIQSGKKSEFAFDPKTKNGLYVWFDCQPPSIEGVEDIEDISNRNHGTSLDRVFSGGLHKPRYKATIKTLEALQGVVRYLHENIAVPPLANNSNSNEPITDGLAKQENEHAIFESDNGIAPPIGNQKPNTTTIEVLQYKRDLNVISWVLRKADGMCENCGRNAPFIKDDGTPFLEVHHLRRLADDGSDTTTNAIAICPNCHRELHYGLNKGAAKMALYGRVERLVIE